jgi:ABC-type nitrate/sulfonate/bicarbonate transport system substrate-binding protein
VLRSRTLSLLVIAWLLAACSTGTATDSPSATPAASTPTSASPTAEPSMPDPEQQSISFGISETDPAHFPLQLAFYAGMFEKYGLTAEPKLFPGPDATYAALAAGEIDVASAVSGETILSLTGGTPAVDIALLSPKRAAPLPSPPPTVAPLGSGETPAPTPAPPPPTPFAGANLMVLRSFAATHPNTTLRIVAAVLEASQLPYTDLATVVGAYASWAQVDETQAKAAVQSYIASGTGSRNLRGAVDAYVATRDALVAQNASVAKVDLTKVFDSSFLDELAARGLYNDLGVPAS